jgi:hypothetical protein
MRRKIKKDKLGEYLVSTYTRRKPTTIEHMCKCPECNSTVKFTGTLKSRQEVLRDTKTLCCPMCDKLINWYNTNIEYDFDFEETERSEVLKPAWTNGY